MPVATMPLHLLAAASRLAEAPGAEVVVFDAAADLSHPGVLLSGSETRVSKSAADGDVRASRRAFGPPQHDAGERSFPSPLFLEAPGRYLRICDLDAPDLGAVASFDGVLVEGIEAPWMVERLGARLAVAEAEAGLPDGTLRIVAVIGTAQGILSLPSFRALPRLAGIACDPGRLAASLRCAIDAPAIVQARAMTVLAAASCAVPAILVLREADTGVEHEGFGAIFLDDRR